MINLFVLPLALAGTLMNAGDGDLFVLGVPLAAGHEELALVAYIGGLSAAAAMVVVASVALSTMISNDLLMPVLLRYERLERRSSGRILSRLIIAIHRGTILLILVLGYVFSRLVGSHYGLANIGFIAFTGVAQFAPAILLGICWRGASRRRPLGILAGVAVWLYTLVLPALASVGLIGASFVGQGAFGIELLRLAASPRPHRPRHPCPRSSGASPSTSRSWCWSPCSAGRAASSRCRRCASSMSARSRRRPSSGAARRRSRPCAPC